MKKEIKDKHIIKNNIVRNYILLFIFIIIGMGLTLYFCKVYKVYDEYQKATPVISGSLSEITSEEIDHYIIDNPSIILYMCTASNEECRYFEKDLKKYVQKESLQDDIVYLNLSSADIDSFINDFNSNYKYKHKLTSHMPAFVSFSDGKITAIVQEKKNKRLSISKVKHFIDIIKAEDEEVEIPEQGE